MNVKIVVWAGIIVLALSTLFPHYGITAANVDAYCTAKGGTWEHFRSGATTACIKWRPGPSAGCPICPSGGRIYVWWDKETGRIQLND